MAPSVGRLFAGQSRDPLHAYSQVTFLPSFGEGQPYFTDGHKHRWCTYSQVAFLPSFGEGQRGVLLRHAAAVVYTPHNEHFGIVPLEAMCVWREKREVDASTSASSPSRPCACGVRSERLMRALRHRPPRGHVRVA